MPTKTKNSPSLRFPEFKGEWEQKKLGEVSEIVMGQSPESKSYNTLGIGKHLIQGNADISDRKSKPRNWTSEPTKECFIGDLILTVRAPVGAVAKSSHNACIGRGVCAIRNTSKSNIEYLYQFLLDHELKWSSLEQGSTFTAVSGTDIKSVKLWLPPLSEQQKIASFLTSVDERIQQLKQQKELLGQYKKGVLQKIFSQELRFKDDKGKVFSDWKEKKLGDCLDYMQPTNFLVSSTEYNNKFETPVLTAGKTFILGYTNETKGIFKNPLPVIIFDDFTTATQFVDFPFKAKSSAMKILIAKENMSIKFMFEAMRMMNYEIGGHERHWISKFSPKIILIPSYEEQTKIANFLSAIDDKITKVAEALEAIQQWKKGLLQKMFV